MLEKETNKRVVRDAIGIVIKLNENGFINTDDEENYEMNFSLFLTVP